jgi:vacuolar-type H+-ATPase subunit I/STV1
MSMELNTERVAHNHLKGASQLLLNAVWDISPVKRLAPKIPIDELPRRIAELHSFVSASIEDQKILAIEEVRRELAATLPEISVAGERSLPDAVNAVVAERVSDKETEMLKRIKILEKREQKLNRKLENAMLQLKSVRTPQKSTSPARAVAAMSDLDTLKDEWEVQRERLDLRMSELSQGISRTLQSPFGSRNAK